jgi:hypothetical protein
MSRVCSGAENYFAPIAWNSPEHCLLTTTSRDLHGVVP